MSISPRNFRGDFHYSLDNLMKSHYNNLVYRGMAKFGIALGSGPRGPGFESRCSDQIRKSTHRVGFLIWMR